MNSLLPLSNACRNCFQRVFNSIGLYGAICTVYSTMRSYFSPPIDSIWVVMPFWRLRGNIIRTAPCCVVYDSCTQWYTHTNVSSSYSSLDWVLSCWVHFTMHTFICVYLCVVCFFCFLLHICYSIVSVVGWTWREWTLILRTKLRSVLWHCWMGHITLNKKPSCRWGTARRAVSWNLVQYCTHVRRIALEKACNRGMTFKAIQGH